VLCPLRAIGVYVSVGKAQDANVDGHNGSPDGSDELTCAVRV
jgi:hypothetical protein